IWPKNRRMGRSAQQSQNGRRIQTDGVAPHTSLKRKRRKRAMLFALLFDVASLESVAHSEIAASSSRWPCAIRFAPARNWPVFGGRRVFHGNRRDPRTKCVRG